MSRHLVALLAAVSAALLSTPGARAGELAPSILEVRAIVYGPSLLDSFRRPQGLAADSTRGLLVVADTGRNRLVVLDANARARGTIGCASETQTCEPRAVAFDARGRLYVVDNQSADIEVLSPLGTRLATLRPAPLADVAPAARPQHVTVGAGGRIYAAYGGERSGVLAFDPDGAVALQLGFEAEEPRAFRGPVCVAVNGDETAIAVVDPEAEKAISVWDAAGTLVAAFGPHGEGEGTLSMAVHAAWGPGGTLWVTDTIRHSISVFDGRGKYLGRIGGFGRGPGQFDYPIACAFLAADRVAVLERAGARCQVLVIDVGGLRTLSGGLSSGSG